MVGFPRLNFLLAQAGLIVRLLRLVRSEGISIVRVSDPYYPGLFGLLLARLSRTLLVVRVNANQDFMYETTGEVAYPRVIPWRGLEKVVARLVFRRGDLIVGGNENNRQFALANGAPPERSALFRAGTWVDPIHFRTEPHERPSIRSELDIGDRPFVILVARLEPLKHPEDIVHVLAAAKARHPELVAVFAGEGRLRGELEELARKLGVADDVRFVGNRNQEWVAAALTEAAVVLSPVTGRSLVEACLSGTPVVAYDAEWQSELVSTGETGVLVPYRDTEKMAEATCDLLDDPALAARLGDRARIVTLEMMDPERLTEHERSTYARLLGLSEDGVTGTGRSSPDGASPVGPPTASISRIPSS